MSEASMQKVLKQGFSTFLRRRRVQQHFERHPLLEALAAAPDHRQPQGLAWGLPTRARSVRPC